MFHPAFRSANHMYQIDAHLISCTERPYAYFLQREIYQKFYANEHDVNSRQRNCDVTRSLRTWNENITGKKSKMLLLLFMTMFCGSLSVNLIPDYIMQNGILGDCDATVTDKEDAYIRSHTGAYQLGSAISYNENENCKLIYDAGEGNNNFHL